MQLSGLKWAKKSVRGDEQLKVDQLTVISSISKTVSRLHVYIARLKQSQPTPPMHYAHREGPVSGSKIIQFHLHKQRKATICFRLKLAQREWSTRPYVPDHIR